MIRRVRFESPRGRFRLGRAVVFAALAAACGGCGPKDDTYVNPRFVNTPSDSADWDPYADVKTITFLDDLQSNATPETALSGLTFTDTSGQEKKCGDVAAGRPIVIVMTRGSTDPICPYCSKQASQLIARYDEFSQRGAEVLLVYPIKQKQDATRLDAFLKNTREILADPDRPVPFPIVLDVELKAVDTLGIRKNLSKPATYILDPKGEVRFAYVGKALGDRPSVDAMLKQLDTIAPQK